MTEKIGSDVLNAQERAQQQQIQEKKKKELMQKLAEEKSKRMSDELDGKKIHEEMPNDQHKARQLGESGYDLINVRAHRRSSPRRQKRNEK